MFVEKVNNHEIVYVNKESSYCSLASSSIYIYNWEEFVFYTWLNGMIASYQIWNEYLFDKRYIFIVNKSSSWGTEEDMLLEDITNLVEFKFSSFE